MWFESGDSFLGVLSNICMFKQLVLENVLTWEGAISYAHMMTANRTCGWPQEICSISAFRLQERGTATSSYDNQPTRAWNKARDVNIRSYEIYKTYQHSSARSQTLLSITCMNNQADYLCVCERAFFCFTTNLPMSSDVKPACSSPQKASNFPSVVQQKFSVFFHLGGLEPTSSRERGRRCSRVYDLQLQQLFGTLHERTQTHALTYFACQNVETMTACKSTWNLQIGMKLEKDLVALQEKQRYRRG